MSPREDGIVWCASSAVCNFLPPSYPGVISNTQITPNQLQPPTPRKLIPCLIFEIFPQISIFIFNVSLPFLQNSVSFYNTLYLILLHTPTHLNKMMKPFFFTCIWFLIHTLSWKAALLTCTSPSNEIVPL